MVLGEEGTERVGSEKREKRGWGGWTSSSGGIWALWGKKRSRTLPMTATERPFPEPGHRSCGRDKCEVSQEVWKGSSRSSGFTSHTHMLPDGFKATCKQFRCVPLRLGPNCGK